MESMMITEKAGEQRVESKAIHLGDIGRETRAGAGGGAGADRPGEEDRDRPSSRGPGQFPGRDPGADRLKAITTAAPTETINALGPHPRIASRTIRRATMMARPKETAPAPTEQTSQIKILSAQREASALKRGK